MSPKCTENQTGSFHQEARRKTVAKRQEQCPSLLPSLIQRCQVHPLSEQQHRHKCLMHSAEMLSIWLRMEEMDGNIITYAVLPKIIKRLLNVARFNVVQKDFHTITKTHKGLAESSYFTLSPACIHFDLNLCFRTSPYFIFLLSSPTKLIQRL